MKRRHLLALIAVAGMAAVPGLAQAEESFVGGKDGHDDHGGDSRYGEAGHDDHSGERRHDEAGQEHNLGLDN